MTTFGSLAGASVVVVPDWVSEIADRHAGTVTEGCPVTVAIERAVVEALAAADDTPQARQRQEAIEHAAVVLGYTGHHELACRLTDEYDHHLGYAAEHHEDVEAVCTTCHHAREVERRAT